MADPCEQFGISQKTGYKHLAHYAASGLAGLQPRSHRPHTFPQRTDAVIEALVLATDTIEPRSDQRLGAGLARDMPLGPLWIIDSPLELKNLWQQRPFS